MLCGTISGTIVNATGANNVAQVVATTVPTDVPTDIPTSVPTAVPTSTSNGLAATHGTPQIGALLSDFVGKYGQPVSQGIGNSQNFYADTAQTITLNVSTTGQKQQVTQINFIGPDTWSDTQTKTFTTQYLPSDAVEFNTVDNLTDYHSSVGEIVLRNEGQGTGLLYTAQT